MIKASITTAPTTHAPGLKLGGMLQADHASYRARRVRRAMAVVSAGDTVAAEIGPRFGHQWIAAGTKEPVELGITWQDGAATELHDALPPVIGPVVPTSRHRRRGPTTIRPGGRCWPTDVSPLPGG